MKTKPQSPLHFTPNPLRTTAPSMQFYHNSHRSGPNFKRVSLPHPPCATAKFPIARTSLGRRTQVPSVAFSAANSHLDTQTSSSYLEATEERLDKV
ncbi:hypothetical protein F3Y22_tig00002237pilonHSYRG00939 [Hibiscus syriacus]|uniref:Uncharacterized protein n=1 Tax=Hibiscus syriacus TaxID=106335 RepID=A0A6A3CSA5_HIBSY|nr:hypothetical protein F3Y22_tig00002237pilonHSYRG00939 [Hibiscus syriacus]